MENNDRIYEAYCGKMGTSFQEETKERIDWIIGKVSDNKSVLDIGCSQGIISILLAEKSKHVVGIDVQESAIDFANQLLEQKYSNLSNVVSFSCSNIMDTDLKETFDYIIITEVIEHLETPQQVLLRAKSYLKPDGKIVITCPLGVCNHPDHRETYYLSNLGELIQSMFSIESIDFIGQWIGFVCNASSNSKIDIKDYYVFEEVAFKSKEIKLNDQISSLRDNLIGANEKYRQVCENYQTVKKWNENNAYKYQKSVSEMEDYKGLLDEKSNEYNELKKQSEAERIQIQIELDNMKCEKEISENTHKKFEEELQDKINRVTKENELITLKYQELCKKVENLAQDLNDKKDKCEKNKIELCNCYDELSIQENFLSELNQYIHKIETQNNYLLSENTECRRRLSIITDSWYGKIGIKVYHILSRVKRRIRRK